ncbi:uncharacterized protein CBL_21502, partial [Carabus blaptoides fortunei]
MHCFGKCGVAVIRISGPNSGEALKKLVHLKQLPTPRMAHLKKIYCPVSKEILDKGLILWFPGPNSFSGEDCFELQVHGGTAVISAILNALRSLPDLRPAEPGEFTRKAFHNGKLDLIEVEGLADLLEAKTELQRKQALIQTEGILSELYNSWRAVLVKSVAHIEAHIDFEESEILEKELFKNTVNEVQIVYDNIKSYLNDGRKGEIISNGIKTVIIGAPNVGKSSLLNNLCQRPAAIVSPIEGTTRDLLQITLDINGYPVVLLDTAGLRKITIDPVEEEGVRRAKNSVETADFMILVLDVNKYIKWKQIHVFDNFFTYLNEYIDSMDLNYIRFDNSNTKKVCKYMIVLNKSDLMTQINEKQLIDEVLENNQNTVLISCSRGDGLQQFLEKITGHFEDLCGDPNREHPSMNRERHRHLLSACVHHLEQFLHEFERDAADVAIVAQYLRLGLRQIGKLTGNVTTEELLN